MTVKSKHEGGGVEEVLKLLDVGIIYPIVESKWVTPTQVVPKKSGVTIVEGESRDLIPTRTVTGVNGVHSL